MRAEDLDGVWEAEAKVVAALGDPRLARRGFLKANLSRRQEKFFVEGASYFMRAPSALVFSIFVFAIAFAVFPKLVEGDILFIAILATMATIPLVRFVQQRVLLPRKKYRLLLHLGMFPSWAILSHSAVQFVVQNLEIRSEGFYDATLVELEIFMAVLQGFWLYWNIRLHRMVCRKIHDADLAKIWEDALGDQGRFS